MITQSYCLDMIPGGMPVRVPVSQYDAGSRSLVFELHAGDQAFSIPAGAQVTCDGTKPDGLGFSCPAVYSGAMVTVPLREQMTQVSGKVSCQLTVRQKGAVLGSANFLLLVEGAALGSGTGLSDSDYTVLEEALRQGAAVSEAAETLTKLRGENSLAEQRLLTLDQRNEAAEQRLHNLEEALEDAQRVLASSAVPWSVLDGKVCLTYRKEEGL